MSKKINRSTVYIGLGTNQGNRQEIIRHALLRLVQTIGEMTACSSTYESPALGFESEYLFLNAVAEFQTMLTPEALLEILHMLENESGRQRSAAVRYSDRTLDLDLLYYDNLQLESDTLTLPHPRIGERRFVLEPLVEIAPHLNDPKHGSSVSEMLLFCPDPSVLRVLPKSVK